MMEYSNNEVVFRCLSELEKLRDTWSSDVPVGILDSKSGQKNKYRAGWFTAIFLYLDTLSIFGGIQFNDDFVNKYSNFRSEYGKKVSLENGLTSSEDIQVADDILSESIEFLQTRYSQS